MNGIICAHYVLVYFIADEKGSDDLLKVTLNLVSHEPCNANYRNEDVKLPKGIINDWQICAGETGKDTCQVIQIIKRCSEKLHPL